MGFRQGITEVGADLFGGPRAKVSYGSDLFKTVPNNAKINPRDSVRVIEKRKIGENEDRTKLERTFKHGFVEIKAEPGKLSYRKLQAPPKPRKTSTAAKPKKSKAAKFRKKRGVVGMTSRLNRFRG